MINLHEEILLPEAKKQFPLLRSFSDNFYLAGGTALALQIGHRISVDFDFFSREPIKKTLLGKVEEIFNKQLVVLVNNSRELSMVIAEVKYTFLHYPFPILLPLVNNSGINFLSSKEIFVTKAYTIGRRGSLKDYIDIFIGLNENYVNLKEIINLANQKYGEVFNDRLFLEQLLYLDDVENMDIYMREGRVIPEKAILIDYFKETIRKAKAELDSSF